MELASVEDYVSAVEDLFVELPDVVLCVIKRPECGVCKAFVSTVETRLLALAVCGVGNACTGIDDTAEKISAAEENAVALGELSRGDLVKGLPGGLRGETVVFVVTVGTDVISGALDCDIIGGVQYFIASCLGKSIDLCEKLIGSFGHFIPPEL
jgi:hypothetical protein